MSLKPFIQRGAASPPPHPRIAEHYLTSYGRDFQAPAAGAKAKQCFGAAGFPTPHITEAICLPGGDHAMQRRTQEGHVPGVPGSPSAAPIAPPCEGNDTCVSRLADSTENPRRVETTYGSEFNGINSVRNPVAEHHQCSSPSGTGAPLSATLKYYSDTARCSKQKEKTLCSSAGAGATFAAINTFKTTYTEKFNDASSIRALVPSSSCTDTRLITGPICGPPYWGVSEKPPPYVPGAEFTYPAEKPIIRHVDKSTTHDSYQHRTREHEVISYDAGGEAICRANPSTTPAACSSTVEAALGASGHSSIRFADLKVSPRKNEVEAASHFSGTNPSATAPRRYRLYEALQPLDRRHDSFALASGIEQGKLKAEAEAAAKLTPQTRLTRPSLHDMFEHSQKSLPARDTCGVRGETCGLYGDVCPMYGDVSNAGLDAFHESANKFVPIKSDTSTKIPYCKPWQPLTKVIHADAEPKTFDFIPAPIPASDGFIPVCPAARHDGHVTGRRRKDWKPKGCTVEA